LKSFLSEFSDKVTVLSSGSLAESLFSFTKLFLIGIGLTEFPVDLPLGF
jgi:hypothetical protein